MYSQRGLPNLWHQNDIVILLEHAVICNFSLLKNTGKHAICHALEYSLPDFGIRVYNHSLVNAKSQCLIPSAKN